MGKPCVSPKFHWNLPNGSLTPPLGSTNASGDASEDISKLSQADAAYYLLNKVLREPVNIAGLVHALRAHGIKVGGANPNINLSSTLSKDERFRSVRYRERSCWWVNG